MDLVVNLSRFYVCDVDALDNNEIRQVTPPGQGPVQSTASPMPSTPPTTSAATARPCSPRARSTKTTWWSAPGTAAPSTYAPARRSRSPACCPSRSTRSRSRAASSTSISRRATASPNSARRGERHDRYAYHVVPADFPPYPGRQHDHGWPCMHCGENHHRTVMIRGKAFREVSDNAWNVERRLEEMAIEGVERQVLSPMPELLSYWFELETRWPSAATSTAASPRWSPARRNTSTAWAWCPCTDPERAARECAA